MPILLNTPIVEPAEHGGSGETLTMLNLVDFRVQAEKKMAKFLLEYGNYDLTDPENPIWKPSNLTKPFCLILRDVAAETGWGVDPEDGEYKEGITVGAKTDFSDAVAAIEVKQEHVGKKFLTALGGEIYLYVIAQMPTYAGTVI